jgi:hypothetical protein
MTVEEVEEIGGSWAGSDGFVTAVEMCGKVLRDGEY